MSGCLANKGKSRERGDRMKVEPMRRTHRLTTITLVLLLLCAPSTADAWGATGHRIVAEIAYKRLSIRARREVRRLLGDRELYEIANWADEIRPSRRETGPWHYVDIQVRDDGSADAF